MPTFTELLEAKDDIHTQSAITKDEIMVATINQQIRERRTREENKAKRKKPKKITYLSKEERDTAIKLIAVATVLQVIIEEWDALGNRPTVIIGALRTAKTMTYKAIEWMIKDVPQKDYQAILSDIGYYTIGAYEYTPRLKGAKQCPGNGTTPIGG